MPHPSPSPAPRGQAGWPSSQSLSRTGPHSAVFTTVLVTDWMRWCLEPAPAPPTCTPAAGGDACEGRGGRRCTPLGDQGGEDTSPPYPGCARVRVCICVCGEGVGCTCSPFTRRSPDCIRMLAGGGALGRQWGSDEAVQWGPHGRVGALGGRAARALASPRPLPCEHREEVAVGEPGRELCPGTQRPTP